MSGETEAQVSGWTTDTLMQHMNKMFAEHDLRYEQRFQSQEENLKTAMTASEKAVGAALASAEKAVGKAEIAAEKRFDAVNEFRGQLADQARDFMPRKESELQHQALADRVSANETKVSEFGARGKGLQEGWGYVVGGFGALLGVAGLIVALTH